MIDLDILEYNLDSLLYMCHSLDSLLDTDKDNPHHSFHDILCKSNNKGSMHNWLIWHNTSKTNRHVLTVYFDLTKFIVSILWKVKRIMITTTFVVVYDVASENRTANDLVYWRRASSFVFVTKLSIKSGRCIRDVKWKSC